MLVQFSEDVTSHAKHYQSERLFVVPVDDSVEDQDDKEWSNDVEDDVGPKAVDVDVPKIHSRTNLEPLILFNPDNGNTSLAFQL